MTPLAQPVGAALELALVEPAARCGYAFEGSEFTHEIMAEVAHNLSAKHSRKVRYRLGEGITGKVVQSGKPAIIPRISEEPQFLNRTVSDSGSMKTDQPILATFWRLLVL